MPSLRPKPKQVLIAADQLLNSLVGGWADETFSARCWRLRERGRGWSALRWLVDGIFFWDPEHCAESWRSEAQRTQLPGEYQSGRPRPPLP